MNSTNYNSLIKLAASAAGPTTGTAPASNTPIPGDPRLQAALKEQMQAAMKANPHNTQVQIKPNNQTNWQYPRNFPHYDSQTNPATGGHRIATGPERYDGGVGAFPAGHRLRQGILPVRPSSSGDIGPYTLRDANAQADAVQKAQAINEQNKLKVSQNFDALFRNLHNVNQQRAKAGLPAYQPNAIDVYAPYADPSKDNEYDAMLNSYNDAAMANLTAEAARRGTPYNPAEINYIQKHMLPQNGEQVRSARQSGELMGDKDPWRHTIKANNYQFLKD